MRKRAPLLDLGGDKFAAKRWIPWAQRQLDRLKLLVGGDPINRLLRPVNGTAVHIRSVGGNDFIRIEVAQGGEYSCEFPTVLHCSPVNCSDFQLRCWNPHNAVGFWMKTSTGYWDNYHWEFGDGNTLDGGDSTAYSFSHEYDAPGTYTVSCTASLDDVVQTKTMDESTIAGLANAGFHGGWPGLDANAWANYLATAPGSISSGDFHWLLDVSRSFTDRQEYHYHSQDIDVDFDMTSVDPTATCTLIQIVARKNWVVHYPNYGDPETIVADGNTGAISNLGVTAYPVLSGVWEDLELGDMTPYIGTVKNITIKTSTDHAKLPVYLGGLPTPAFAPSVFNRIGLLGSVQPYVRVEIPGFSKTTTKVIKVNTGRPKKTRQIGESIHT